MARSNKIMLENFLTSAWNRLVAPAGRGSDRGSRLDLGFQVVDGEVQRSRAYVLDSKRAEHLAILGKTGRGKSFLLRYLSGQDIHRRSGFVSFDLHGDTTPYLLRRIATEE